MPFRQDINDDTWDFAARFALRYQILLPDSFHACHYPAILNALKAAAAAGAEQRNE